MNLGKISTTLEGAYDSSRVYNRLEVVTNAGSSYTSRIDNNNKPLTDETAWQKSSAKGDKGDPGPKGDTGYKTVNPDLINPSDPAPTVDGEYRPALSSRDNIDADPNNYGTLYPNINNFRAKEGYDTLFVRRSGVWTRFESKLPQVSPNIRLLEDLPNGTILNEKEQVISNNVTYIVKDGETAVVGTDLPTGSKFKPLEKNISDLKVFADTDIAVLQKSENFDSPNVEKGILLVDAYVYNEAFGTSYFTSTFQIEDNSLRYFTRLNSGLASICIFDGAGNLIQGKALASLINPDTGYVERVLDDDFDLTNAATVKITCHNTSNIKVFYDKDIVIYHTIDVLDLGSKKGITSKAVVPLQEDIIENANNIVATNEIIEDLQVQIEELKEESEFVNRSKQPLYMELTGLVKGFNSSYASFNKPVDLTIPILSRDSDYQFTCATSDLSIFPDGKSNNGIVLIGASDGKHASVRCVIDKSTGIVTTFDKLPASFTSFAFLYGDSIHLSETGYKSMAEWFVDNCLWRRVMRKNKKFAIYGRNLDNIKRDFVVNGVTVLETKTIGTPEQGGIWNQDGINYAGGWGSHEPESADKLNAKFTNQWRSNQRTPNVGFEWTINTGIQGYLKFLCGLTVESKNPITLNFKDQDGNILFTQTKLNIGLQEILVDLNRNIKSVTIQAIWTNSTTSSFNIDQIEVFETYQTDEPVIKDGDSIALVMDSWGGFRNLISGETGFERPDGSIGNGKATFATRVKSYLAEKGINVEIYNWSLGGMTSAFGEYWVDYFIDESPTKPTFLITNFIINDLLSVTNPNVGTFSSVSPYSNTAPYIAGNTDINSWYSNIKSIANKALAKGVQPIIFNYPQYTSVNFPLEQYNLKILTPDRFLA